MPCVHLLDNMLSKGSHIHLCHSLTYVGPLDPIEHIEVLSHCETKMMDVSWSRPYTLEGITIPSYNICVDDACQNLKGDVQSAAIPFPVINASFADEYHLCIQAHDCSSANYTESSCTTFTLNEGMHAYMPSLLYGWQYICSPYHKFASNISALTIHLL